VERSAVPATAVTADPIRLGTMLYTLVEPHRGHEVAYNRWYERDHFYAGCQIGAYNFAGGRFVATSDLKALRRPVPGGAPAPLVDDPQVGSYLALYFVLDGHHDEWNRWAVDQVNLLHAAGRMFTERDHVHTGLYRFAFEHRRDDDGVPAELVLDHRFSGLVSVFIEAERGPLDELVEWYRTEALGRLLPGSPVATVLGFTPLPLLGDAPGDVPRDAAAERRLLLLCFLDEEPATAWPRVLAGHPALLGERGRLVWEAPFRPTVVGTDTYTDHLWGDQP
jgi:hypothetical protein